MEKHKKYFVRNLFILCSFLTACSGQRTHTLYLNGAFAYSGFRDDRFCVFAYEETGLGYSGGYRLQKGRNNHSFIYGEMYLFRERYFDYETLSDRIVSYELFLSYGYHYSLFTYRNVTISPGLVIDYDHTAGLKYLNSYWLTTSSFNISVLTSWETTDRLAMTFSLYTPLVTFLNRIPWTSLHYDNFIFDTMFPFGTTGSEIMIFSYNSLAMEISGSFRINRHFNATLHYRFMYKHINDLHKSRAFNMNTGLGMEWNFARRKRGLL